VRLILEQDGDVPFAEDVAVAAVALVEAARVHAVELLHPEREVRSRQADEQMVMRTHQAVPRAGPRVAADCPGEPTQEETTVGVVEEELAPPRGPRADVEPRAGVLDPERLGHAMTVPAPTERRKGARTTGTKKLRPRNGSVASAGASSL
jgi:hypothetical protein